MTRLALGAKCGSPGSPPIDSGAAPAPLARRSSLTSVARAAAPIPVLESCMKRRRVRSRSSSEFIGYSFVMVRSRLRIRLATIVWEASSATSSVSSRGDSPMLTSSSAADRSPS